jgi:hypothetical protein
VRSSAAGEVAARLERETHGWARVRRADFAARGVEIAA